jgi:hypothetical protein
MAPCRGGDEGVERVELDERWHIGFGLRCLIESEPSPELLDDLLARAEEAVADMCHHRLAAAGLIEPRVAA